MCGIAGLLSPGLTDDRAEHYSKQLLHSLKHRGPDDNGSWVDIENGLLMIHTRLSIHDLSSAGAQPMHSASGVTALSLMVRYITTSSCVRTFVKGVYL